MHYTLLYKRERDQDAPKDLYTKDIELQSDMYGIFCQTLNYILWKCPNLQVLRLKVHDRVPFNYESVEWSQ